MAFWLEYDTGTERPITRVTARLAGYAHLGGTQVDRPVLFWLPTAVREATLRDELARAGLPARVQVATAAADHAAALAGAGLAAVVVVVLAAAAGVVSGFLGGGSSSDGAGGFGGVVSGGELAGWRCPGRLP